MPRTIWRRRVVSWLLSAYCSAPLMSSQGFACPVCSSESGVRVRRAILGPDLWRNVSATIAPFAVLFAIVAWFRYVGPKSLKLREDGR